MKKLTISLSAILLTMMTLSGCEWQVRHTELDKLAIAEMIGIDYDSGGYTVTLQYFNTDASGGMTSVDVSSPNAVTVTGSGNTIESALRSVSYTAGKDIMLGSAEIIVFGRDAAFSLRDSLSFAAAHYSGNPRCTIAVSDGKASDVLNVKFTEGDASVEKLAGMMSNAQQLGLNRPLKMYEAQELLCCPTESIVMPLIKTYTGNKDFTESSSSAVITGGALCTDGRLADTLTVAEMSGVTLLTAKGSPCEVTFRLHGEDVRVTIYAIDPKIVPSMTEDGLRFDVSVSANCKYVSTSLPAPYKSRAEVEILCERELSDRIGAALSKTVTKYGADIFGLCYKIRAHSPQMWETVKNDYREYMKGAVFAINCDVHIERFGVMHGDPGGN